MKYKKKYISFLLGILLVGLMVLNMPNISFFLGNKFFGEYKTLYNIRFAKFFYKTSIYSSFFKDTPVYTHYQLSRTYFIQGDLTNALKEAQRELEVHPENTQTYYILGLTYGYLGKIDEGISAFSSYIKTHPDTWAGRNDKAWLLFSIGDIDRALKVIKPAAEKYKSTPWVQNTYCVLLINKEKYDEAKKVCNDAKKIIDNMTEKDWGHAYPGNDPRIYNDGLKSMQKSINENLDFLQKQTGLK